MQPPLSTAGAPLPSVRIVGFTGHRAVQQPEAIAEAFRSELTKLKKAGGEMIAISSIAVGADTIFAQEVLRAGLKWIVVLPMPKEIFRGDFQPDEWSRAEALITKAAEVRVLHGNDRPQAYVDCGKATVDDSDSLLALWDGKPAQGPGGTAEVIAYARMLGREVTVLRESETGIAKVDPTQVPAVEYAPEDLLRAMGPPVPLPPPPQGLRDQFKTCDDLATKTAPNFRSKTLRMSGYHLTATLIAGLSLTISALHVPFPLIVLSALKVIFVTLALFILLTLRQTHTHEIWLEHRLTAEYLRSILATWHCRDLVEPVSFHEVPELRDLAQSALFLRLEKDPNAMVDIKAFRSAYAHDRVMGQWKYFRDEGDRAEAKAGPIRTRYWIYTWAAVIFSGILFLLKFGHTDFNKENYAGAPWYIQTLMVLLDVSPLAFPAMASFALARMAIEDVDRRVGRFRDLQNKMRLTLIDLSFCSSWESLCRSVGKTEKILFNEVLEWYSISRYSATD